MPSRTMRSGDWPISGLPRYVIVPACGVTVPVIAASVVDLPAPFGPTMATISRSRTSKEISRSAAPRPYRTASPSTVSIGRLFLSRGGTEVRLDHARVPAHLVRKPLGDRPPVVEHVDPMAEPEDQGHVVFDHEQPELELARHGRERLQQALRLGLVEAGRGLVEQEEVRAAGQRADQAQPSLLAVRQAGGREAGELGEVHALEEAPAQLARGAGAEATGNGTAEHVFEHGQAAEQ